MIKFDFDSMSVCDNKYYNLKDSIINKFNNEYMTGWVERIDTNLVEDIINTSNEVKKHSDCLVVIGIGGSFLGSYAVLKALTPYFKAETFEVIYAGTTLSSEYLSELKDYLKNKDFSVNVISKSGTTMETTITYRQIKSLMEEKYTEEEMRQRIIATTDPVKGALREEANSMGYKSFPIPDNIGGRYSIMTSAHLFPLAFNIDLKSFIDGYYNGIKYIDDAFRYAVMRKSLFDKGKFVENYVVYEEKLEYFSEWLKQLYGESEGKNGVGILPTSTVHTRDLHSLGQFIQQGNKIVFETFIKVSDSNKLSVGKYDLHEVNNVVLDSVRIAHKKGDVSSILITLPNITEYNLGELMFFFMLGAAFSGYLFDINPFDQPGVEVYKKEVREKIII